MPPAASYPFARHPPTHVRTAHHSAHHPTPPHPADAVVVSQPVPATSGILVRVTVRFQAKTASAQADTLVKHLTDSSLLRRMLPEASWKPRLLYTTLPYLVRGQGQRASATPVPR